MRAPGDRALRGQGGGVGSTARASAPTSCLCATGYHLRYLYRSLDLVDTRRDDLTLFGANAPAPPRPVRARRSRPTGGFWPIAEVHAQPRRGAALGAGAAAAARDRPPREPILRRRAFNPARLRPRDARRASYACAGCSLRRRFDRPAERFILPLQPQPTSPPPRPPDERQASGPAGGDRPRRRGFSLAAVTARVRRRGTAHPHRAPVEPTRAADHPPIAAAATSQGAARRAALRGAPGVEAVDGDACAASCSRASLPDVSVRSRRAESFALPAPEDLESAMKEERSDPDAAGSFRRPDELR